MLSSKERKFLSGMGQTLEPIFQVGKNGLDGNILGELSDALEKRELIKISVLKNCDNTAKEVAVAICEELNAEPVSVVGSKVVVYRRSQRKDIKHIEF